MTALAITFCCSKASTAASITFQDSFQRDNQIALFSIFVSAPTSVSIRSVGYGGYGNLIPAGGFDTYLTLFDASGFLVAENDDGENALIDPATGQGFDAQFTQELLPGTYSFALTQYGNYALGPNYNDGFSQAGNASYTNDPDFAPGEGCAGGLFKDVSGGDGRCRTGNYTIQFINEDQGATASILDSNVGATSETPEPSTLALMLLGSVLIGLGIKRQRLATVL